MGSLLATTIPLALGAAVSPVLFLLQLVTLTGPRRLVRGSALALGALLPLLAVGTLAVAIGNSSWHPSPTAKAVVDLALGAVLFLGVGVGSALRPPAAKPPGQPAQAGGVGRSFVLGLAGMTSNVTTFAFFIPAMRQVALADVSPADRTIVTLLILAITLTTVLLPLLVTAVAPGASGRILTAIGTWLRSNTRRNRVVLGLAFGAWFIVKGALAL